MKELKYCETKYFLKLLKKYKHHFLVISHIHYLTVFDYIKIKHQLYKYNIISVKIRNKIIKKLFKNKFINNLLVVPTNFFFLKTLKPLKNFISYL